MSRAKALAGIVLYLAGVLSALHAAEYEQKQGLAVLRLQADKVDAGQVELSLSSQLVLTLSVEGRVPLQVGENEDAVPQEQIKALLASGAWRKCQALGNPTTTDLGKGRARWQQVFRLDPQRDGQFELRPAPLSYTEGPERQSVQVKWTPVPVRVTTEILTTDLSELRDITPIEEIPPGRSWRQSALWLGLALALGGLVLGGGNLLWRRLRRTPSVSPDRWALGELEQIEALALPRTAEVERYHTLLSDVLRRYLELRFGLHAPQQTTSEFLAAMARASPLSPAQQALLQEFLQRCDLAKFAQAQPSAEECGAVATMARTFVEQTAAPLANPKSPPLPVPDGQGRAPAD
jgi:hypothetical protein